MKSDFLEFIGNARQRRSEKFRNQLYIFIVCLVLSVFIWALVRLSQDYYYSIEYNLHYTQVPGNLKLTSTSDSTLNLKIRVQGFEFFSEQFLIRQDREYDVSLRNVRLRYNGDHVWGYLVTNQVGKEIISQSNFPSDVYFVSPDTLFFEFEKQTIRKIPVRIAPELVKVQSDKKDSVRHRPDSIRHLDPNNINFRKH
ncbi:MAG: hypothetical protein WCO44_05325 [Bacteroidota bacterium]